LRTSRQDSLSLLGRLVELGSDLEAVPIAIERPDGRLVDAGHPVVAVKLTAIKAWRGSKVRACAFAAQSVPTNNNASTSDNPLTFLLSNGRCQANGTDSRVVTHRRY
jgi:hypothetical protein